MNLKSTAVLLLSFLALVSCDKWDLEQRAFLQVELTSVDSLSIDSARISGQITDLTTEQVLQHGFLWTTKDTLPSIFFNEGRRELEIKTREEDPTFSAILDLTPNTHYTFRAYATVDGAEYFYSDGREYRTGNAEAFTLSVDYQSGLSLEANGRLSGTEKGFVAVKHGFCWSTINPQPTLADRFVNLGERRNNEVFTGVVDGLQDNTLHYIRAYAVLSLNFKLDTVYGQAMAFDGNLNFWAQRADFGGVPIFGAVGFSVGQKGYVGTGVDESLYPRADFWEYDPQADAWSQKADFGGGATFRAVGFSVGQKGYVEAGNRGFWEYDPLADAWAQKADFGGGPRSQAVAFSIAQKGYVGTGYDGTYRKDFWEYDPLTDAWAQKADFGGGPRALAVGFAIGPKGYVGTGFRDFDILAKDFWEYDPEADAWTQRADFMGGPRQAIGFSIGQKGYIGMGQKDFEYETDFWEYDPLADTWAQREEFGGVPRIDAVGFSIGQKGYIGTGFSETYVKDFWEFDP